MDMTKLERVERFHRLKNRISDIVKRTIGDKEIIHGERAVAVRVPPHLRRATRDYDVYSKTPEEDAIEAEKELDKEFGGDYFEVVPAEHEGTYKVKSKINEMGYADFTDPEERVHSEVIMGNKYVTLTYLKNRLKRILKDKEKEFRHAKDRDTLNRIRVYEAIRKKTSLGLRQKKELKKQQLFNLISIKKQKVNLLSKGKGLKWL